MHSIQIYYAMFLLYQLHTCVFYKLCIVFIDIIYRSWYFCTVELSFISSILLFYSLLFYNCMNIVIVCFLVDVVTVDINYNGYVTLIYYKRCQMLCTRYAFWLKLLFKKLNDTNKRLVILPLDSSFNQINENVCAIIIHIQTNGIIVNCTNFSLFFLN